MYELYLFSSLTTTPGHPAGGSDRCVCVRVDKDVRVICQPCSDNIATATVRKLDGPLLVLGVLAPQVPGYEGGATLCQHIQVMSVPRRTGPPIPSLSRSGVSGSRPKYGAKSTGAE